jgi:hypothetical protein
MRRGESPTHFIDMISNLRCKNTAKIARVQLFYKKVQKKFGHVKKKYYFCSVK